MWCFSSSPHLAVKGMLPLAIFAFVQGLLTWGICFIVHSWPLITTYTKQDVTGTIEILLLSEKAKGHLSEDIYHEKKQTLMEGTEDPLKAGSESGIPYSEALILYSCWSSGRSFSEECQSHVPVSVSTADIHSKWFCQYSIIVETPISYCLYPSSTHMFVEIWVWPQCICVWNKVIFKQSNFFTELISQNFCIKNSLLKNWI